MAAEKDQLSILIPQMPKDGRTGTQQTRKQTPAMKMCGKVTTRTEPSDNEPTVTRLASQP
jgi:hypothetical protein